MVAANVGAERGRQKTEVIYCLPNLDAAPPEWKVDEMRLLASLSTAAAGSNTLGVSAGPRQFIADQLWVKADVIRAVHERVEVCQDPQTEFALFRESLGVSRINHILRVHEILGVLEREGSSGGGRDVWRMGSGGGSGGSVGGWSGGGVWCSKK